MKADDETNFPNWKSRLQIRFSLRTAILLFTVISIGLGYVVTRQRRAAEIEAWDRALRNVLCESIATLPGGTAFIQPSPPAAALGLQNRQFEELSELDLLVPNSIQKINSTASWTPMFALDVARELTHHSPIVVANRLLRHYESGLADHGMSRISSIPGTCNPTSSDPSSVWISDRQGLSTVVIIEVHVNQATNRGDVRIRHIAPI